MGFANIQLGAVLLCILVWLIPVQEPAVAGMSSSIQQIQALYDKKNYQKAIEEMAKLDQAASSAPDICRLKIRTLLRLGNPKSAVTEYDRLVQMLGHEDRLILREIAVGFIVVLTTDMREQMRGAAYTALKDWPSPEAIPLLEDGLSDGSGLVRALAAEGLAKLDAGRRSDKFRRALEDQAALVKEAVLKGLAKVDDPSVVSLVEPLLKDPEIRVRVAAAEVLCNLQQAQECELLVQYAQAPNPDARTAAIRALAGREPALALPVLVAASEHTQPSVRGAAATGFAHMPTTEAVPVLTRLLGDPLPHVRIAAAVSLGHLHSVGARSPLKKALADHDSAVRAFIIGALLAQDERYEVVAGQVQTLINTKEPATRTAVARALGYATESNHEPARSALMLLIHDTVPRVRIAAIKSMAKIEWPRATPLLKHHLHDEDDAVRATAGGALLNAVLANEEA